MTDDATKQDKPSRASQPALAAQPDFGTRYRVIGVLGKGGMGEVWRAYDTELKREVALKVVRGDADLDAALARFRREIALAAKVTSPNVLRVYDIAEHDGLRFLSMEYVDGEDLAHLMKREKQLPIDRAVQIFKQVCAGLAAAHAQGVVHRDLKPQNVLLDKEGHVRVADFGLARSMTDSSLTASGAILGSPAYMSPEQVKGDPTDERSDIYSLGIMLYQLVTGETPFRADTPHAVMEMRLHKKPKPLRDVRADTPAYLEAIAAKCLALAPSARYGSMRDVLAALEQSAPAAAVQTRSKWLVPALGGGLAVVLGAIAFVAWPRAKHDAPPAPTAKPAPIAAKPAPANGLVTVLVLPFENRTSDPVFDSTLEVMFEYALRRSRRVDPLGTVQVRSLADELGPDVALDDHLAGRIAARDGGRVIALRGSVASRGAAFALTAVATDGATNQPVLSKTVDVPDLAAAPAAIGELASALRAALGDPVDAADRATTGLSASLAADHEFAVGRGMARANDFENAIAHLQRAVAIDPELALAHMQLATAYSNTLRVVDMAREYTLVLKWIDRLGERDRLKFLGDYYTWVTEEYDRAIAAYEELLAKWPKDLAAEVNVAIAYQARGDIKNALASGERAARDHPYNPTARGNVPTYEILAGDYPRAIADLQKIITDFPRPQTSTYQYLALAHLLAGHRKEALDALEHLEQIDPSTGVTAKADLALAEGRLHDAAALLDKGIADDLAHKLADAAEVMQSMRAELALRHGDAAKARAAAALVTKEPHRLREAAFVELAAGDTARAQAAANRLAADVAPSHHAMAKLIEGEALRVAGKPQQAMVVLQDAVKLDDTVLGHFYIARAALDAKLFAEAYSELRTCIARRAEVAFDVNDVPSYRYVPLLTYYLAKAQDGLGSPDAAKSYAAFLAMTHDADADDPLVSDAKKHVQ